MPEMGPVLFQTVVGAVIPSEIAFFSFIVLASRSKKKRQAASASVEKNVPASEVVHQQSGDQKTIHLPRAPALAILVLIIVLSLMVIPAIVSFFIHFSVSGPFFGKVV
jgi:Mg2+/citrate symporter